MKIFKTLSALFLISIIAACTVIPVPSNSDTVPPPNVNGTLNTGGPTRIPFSAYTTGNPVIATEAFVNDKITANGTPVNLGSANTWGGAQNFTFPSTANTPSVSITGSNPQLGFTFTKAATDNKRWDFVTNGPSFSIRAINDAGGNAVNAITFGRNGVTTTGTQFGDGTILASNTYTPTLDNSLTNKKYVDSKLAPTRLRCFVGGSYAASASVCKWLLNENITFPAIFAGSVFTVENTPTADVVFTILAVQSSVSRIVGGITFPKGTAPGTPGIISPTAGVTLTFKPGDTLYVRSPSTANSAFGFAALIVN